MTEKREEHKLYIPLIGTQVEPAPKHFTARWYEEQGRPVQPNREWQFGKYGVTALWTGGTGFELNQKERFLRVWHLLIFWKRC